MSILFVILQSLQLLLIMAITEAMLATEPDLQSNVAALKIWSSAFECFRAIYL